MCHLCMVPARRAHRKGRDPERVRFPRPRPRWSLPRLKPFPLVLREFVVFLRHEEFQSAASLRCQPKFTHHAPEFREGLRLDMHRGMYPLLSSRRRKHPAGDPNSSRAARHSLHAAQNIARASRSRQRYNPALCNGPARCSHARRPSASKMEGGDMSTSAGAVSAVSAVSAGKDTARCPGFPSSSLNAVGFGLRPRFILSTSRPSSGQNAFWKFALVFVTGQTRSPVRGSKLSDTPLGVCRLRAAMSHHPSRFRPSLVPVIETLEQGFPLGMGKTAHGIGQDRHGRIHFGGVFVGLISVFGGRIEGRAGLRFV